MNKMNMCQEERLFLIADIGGTYARLALARFANGVLRVESSSPWLTALHASFDAALETFLNQKGNPRLDAVAVCAAGPVEGIGADAVIGMTNCPWDISAAEIARTTGVEHPLLMNDFAALARAIPHLAVHELHRIGGGIADPTAPIVILGPGTGLGVAALAPVGEGRNVVLPGEGGHADLAPIDTREIDIIYQLMKEFGHVSIERALSGPGLVALYMAIGTLDGTIDKSRPTAADIANWGRMGKSTAAKEAISLFCSWLGSTAGNLALTFGAKGGVYIGGGIVPSWIAQDEKLNTSAHLFDAKLFRSRFEAKGRFRPYLISIPVNVITREDPALLGLAYAVMESVS